MLSKPLPALPRFQLFLARASVQIARGTRVMLSVLAKEDIDPGSAGQTHQISPIRSTQESQKMRKERKRRPDSQNGAAMAKGFLERPGTSTVGIQNRRHATKSSSGAGEHVRRLRLLRYKAVVFARVGALVDALALPGSVR